MALPQHYVEKDFYTEDEYLTWEDEVPFKSEYVRGDIRAMSGGSIDHSTLAVSIGAELRAALRGRDCRVMSSDMKVRTPDNTFRYPDVSVVCGPPAFHGRSRSVITNPVVLVEVLTDSTARTDREEKLREYQRLDSLQHYILVSQHEARLEVYTRAENGHWDYHAVEGREATLVLSHLGVTLALADLYDGIDFDAQGEG